MEGIITMSVADIGMVDGSHSSLVFFILVQISGGGGGEG
jgi:hypothetical protein